MTASRLLRLPSAREFTPLWLTFVLIITPFCGLGVGKSIHNDNLSKREQVASGKLTGFDSTNHGEFKYQFYLNGRKYVGRDAYKLNNNGVYDIGKDVKVYYDPADPNTSGLSSYSTKTWGYIPSIIIWVVTFFLLIFLSRISSKKRSPDEKALLIRD